MCAFVHGPTALHHHNCMGRCDGHRTSGAGGCAQQAWACFRRAANRGATQGGMGGREEAGACQKAACLLSSPLPLPFPSAPPRARTFARPPSLTRRPPPSSHCAGFAAPLPLPSPPPSLPASLPQEGNSPPPFPPFLHIHQRGNGGKEDRLLTPLVPPVHRPLPAPSHHAGNARPCCARPLALLVSMLATPTHP